MWNSLRLEFYDLYLSLSPDDCKKSKWACIQKSFLEGLERAFVVPKVCYKISKITALSKRFVGAGHSEEGGGPGGEGTLPSARRARTFRGVWGHSPLEIFWNLDTQRCHLVQSGRILSVKIVFHLHNSIFSIKWPNVPFNYWHIIQVSL